MATDNRPLSPHLQVYKMEWTMLLSISHRITGAALVVGTLLLAYWLAAAAAGPEAYAAAQGFFDYWLVKLALFGWTFALFYHLSNGVRHLLWDTGWGFDIPTALMTGQVVLGASAALTLLTWIIA